MIPPKPESGIHRALTDQASRDPDAPPTPVSDFWEHDSNGSREEDLVRKRSWRVGREQVQSLRNIVEQFEGTRNYHNFTAGREYSDPSCKRHIKKIQVSNYGLFLVLLIYENDLRCLTRSSMERQSGSVFFFMDKALCYIK